jgi:single-stranded-DNA-specific exonuclease
MKWQIQPQVLLSELPDWLLKLVQETQEAQDYSARSSGIYAAQLLWQRGIRDRSALPGFLQADRYEPTSPFAFGEEMTWAVERLQRVYQQREKVAIWGDFDADGVTSTALLWEGLGQWFPRSERLTYYIPDRLQESHGLSQAGLETLAAWGCDLIITCDTGSTNHREIAYAQNLGMEVIVTDHHTLPDRRPPVVALINPRTLPPDHALAHLSGVAVAYKVVEALYQTLPAPDRPLTDLLDLVAIGLIADLVELKGDCRYLAQKGLAKLQELSHPHDRRRRPGVARLLELCKGNGDRPSDISFGIGPRINAVSRIQGDARLCVNLLTSQDEKQCRQWAEQVEVLNTRRKALQRDIYEQVIAKLAELDLSTTQAIVLAEVGWPIGILGLVAGQITQEYGRPTILLTIAPEFGIAKGSARSIHNIDLYQLFQSQAHLLNSFGGHPLAAGLSLPVENLPLFREALNRQLRESQTFVPEPVIQADLIVTVSELGLTLFRELRLLEPYGMGNPAPRLLIQNCWFDRATYRNLKDRKGFKVRYIKTEFQIWDESVNEGFPGLWWGHYADELPQGSCDAIVELDFNTYAKRVEARLLAVRAAAPMIPEFSQETIVEKQPETIEANPIPVNQIPEIPPALALWQQLVGIAKYLSRTQQTVPLSRIQEKLGVSDQLLQAGLFALQAIGFEITMFDTQQVQIWTKDMLNPDPQAEPALSAVYQFLKMTQEEQFQGYFVSNCGIPLLEDVCKK